ncbi:MAG: extracellular solute-binding protein [Patescibacteria group bacterium]
MSKKYFRFLPLFLILAFLLTAGFGCKGMSAEVANKMKPVTLNYWRVGDDTDAFTEIISDYQQAHPNIKIVYRKFRTEEYEQQLLNALAEDRGPDILSLPADSLREYQSKLEPMPKQITMAYQRVRGTIKKETYYELATTPTISIRQIKDNFVDAVYNDALIDGKVYGLPLSLESLIMFYNKDILNQAAISQVPTDWKTFQDDVAKITKFGENNKIIQAGAALGTGKNTSYSFDILSLLMMQNGAIMSAPNGQVTMFNEVKVGSQNENPGLTALQFYGDFASPIKSVYSWNNDLPNSLDAFLAGNVGFLFAYNHDIANIRSRAPKLNFGVAPVPQIPGNPVRNYANYWVETVSKKSTSTNEAWDFVLFSTKKTEVAKYLAKTKRPTALRELINSELEDEDLHADATQTLTADNWYRGKNPDAAKKIIIDMQDAFVVSSTDEKMINNLMDTTIKKLNQTIN